MTRSPAHWASLPLPREPKESECSKISTVHPGGRKLVQRLFPGRMKGGKGTCQATARKRSHCYQRGARECRYGPAFALGRGLPALKIGGLVRGSYRKFPGRLERGGWPVHCWKSWHRWPARVGSREKCCLTKIIRRFEPNRYPRCREAGGNER
jgi:hypothetical protein